MPYRQAHAFRRASRDLNSHSGLPAPCPLPNYTTEPHPLGIGFRLTSIPALPCPCDIGHPGQYFPSLEQKSNHPGARQENPEPGKSPQKREPSVGLHPADPERPNCQWLMLRGSRFTQSHTLPWWGVGCVVPTLVDVGTWNLLSSLVCCLFLARWLLGMEKRGFASPRAGGP
jgi:hypothetical protein